MARDPNPVEIKIKATSDTKGAKEAEKALDGVDEKVREIAKRQKMQAVADLGSQVERLGRSFRESARDVSVYDGAQGELIASTGELMERTGRAASLIATGFAVGGPAGAVVGGVAALFHELRDSAAEAAEVAARAAAQVETDWKLSAEGIAEAKREVEAYKEAIDAVNETRDESLRKIETEISLNQKLRSAELRRQGKKDEADIAEIESEKPPPLPTSSAPRRKRSNSHRRRRQDPRLLPRLRQGKRND